MNKVILQGHDHPLSLVNHGDGLECDACDGAYHDGYFCSECKFIVHKKCAFVFNTQETLFEHPSHVGHRLKVLSTGSPDHTDPKCHLCGKITKRLLFHCSTCKLNLDIDCMVDAMRARAHLIMEWHPHPLLMVNFNGCLQCDFCGLRFRNGYFCAHCRLMVHKECVVSIVQSTVITHPCHPKHSLRLLTEGAPHYTDLKCHLCGKHTGNLLYHCDICKFNLDMVCATRSPPPVVLSNLKVHEHTLTLIPRLNSFVCDACGTKGDRAPYVCLQCGIMIHRDCARLPLVIHVNRHDHRISYTYPLGLGEWNCGICLEEIDWSCGAYSCYFCRHYALHSRCALRDNVWDGKELDGVPEEAEDTEPFIVNEDNTITHFAHYHNLSLHKHGIALEESILCEACVRPIGSDRFYNCYNGDFFLHERCAKLPKTKRHFLNTSPLTLYPDKYNNKTSCSACLQRCCSGFMYVDGHKSFDLSCSLITVPFTHGSHPHPLFDLDLSNGHHLKMCQSCGIDEGVVIGCIKCNFYLDFRCASLPLTVRLQRYDDHPLTLCYGDKKASGKYWCDICERETNPKTWFYTCKDCGVTLHVLCVLGDIRYAKSGAKIAGGVYLLPNNGSVRPRCSNCHCRCPGPFMLKESSDGSNNRALGDYKATFFCSYYCFSTSRPTKYSKVKVICPPWAL